MDSTLQSGLCGFEQLQRLGQRSTRVSRELRIVCPSASRRSSAIQMAWKSARRHDVD